MAREVGIGLLGVGWMGEVHSTSFGRVPFHFPECGARARLVIAADASAERAQSAVDRLGYAEATTDWRAVLAHPDVDAVCITAPNFMHREMGIAAAEAKKHVRGEKPLGRTPAETAEIVAAAEKAGIRTIVGLNYRHAPAVQYARQLVESGALGAPTHFRMQFVASYSANPRGALSWRFDRELAGLGILGDLGPHALDLAQFLLGPIRRVTATSALVIPRRPKQDVGTGTHFSVGAEDAELGDVGNEDWAAGLIEFASGLKGTVELSRVMVGADARYAFEVNCADGAVRWDFERMNELQICGAGGTGDRGYATVMMGPQHPDFVRFQPGQGLGMGFDDLKVVEAYLFLQSIADGQQRAPGMREMLEAARVIDAMDRSCASGAWEDVRDLL